MRKIISLGLFALMISIFSSQVFASNAEACDVLKGAKKGLHGLCVAWHNANDKHKDKFAAKFEDRAGYPITDLIDGGSNPDFLCRCWDSLSLADVGKDASAGFCLIDDTTAGAVGDIVTFSDAPVGPFQGFGVDTASCQYKDVIVLNSAGDEEGPLPVLLTDLTIDEEVDCRMDIRNIAADHFGKETGPACMVLTTPDP